MIKFNTKNINRSHCAIICFLVLIILFICGCGDFFDEKTAYLESQRIRDDVRVRALTPVDDPNAMLPSIYQEPPKIVEQVVGGNKEFKLFYFCRYHLAAELKQMIIEQFAQKLFDKKGKSQTIPDYTVSTNDATNQLVVRCPMREDVEAVLETLQMVDVPPVQVRISCLISEVYADDTLDWETTLEIGDLLGAGITAGGSARLYGADVLDLITETAPLPAFPGASLREITRAKMGLKVGYTNYHDFLAVVDVLESRGYLKVLMNPTLEVVNGKTAKITSTEHVPLDQIFLHDREGFIETKTEYVDVIDSLEITPHVFADGYIGLETTAVIGSKSIPDGVKQIRIVSKREIYNEQNRIRPGESLVIGGIRKIEEHTVVRGVPFLKDIPLLGILFSSKDYEERAVETMFIITPTISSGGVPNRQMLSEIRRRHKTVDPSSGLQDAVLDPFDSKIRQEEHALKMQQLEQEYQSMIGEREQARRQVREAKEEAEIATSQAQKAKAEAEKARAETEKAKAEAAKAEAEKAKAEAEKAKTEKAKAEAERAKAQAEQKEEESESGKSG